MKRAFLKLPGPMPVKIVLAVILISVALYGLNSIYNWMGNFLDSGGTLS